MTDQTALIDPFITRWGVFDAAERANYQLYLSELCDLLGVKRPRGRPWPTPRPCSLAFLEKGSALA